MKSRFMLVATALLLAIPATSVLAQTANVAESKQEHSTVNLLVEPQLNDGRLVIRIAAKNLAAGPVAFGPSSISISRPSGEPIPLSSLQALIDDVRLAAGIGAQSAPASETTQGAYASPQMGVRDGRVDVTGYTGGAGLSGDEYIRRKRAPPGKPTISKAEAETQIAALRQAILQDGTLSPGQIAAGQVVSSTLKFKKGEDRTLHVRVRVGSEEHGFTIAAPNG